MNLNEYYRNNKDEINSSIMEIASDLAVARMVEKHQQPFDTFVESDPDDDDCTHYKEEYQDEYDQFYDEEYARIAEVMKFDFCEEDGVAKDGDNISNRIDNLFMEYMKKQGKEPRFANCTIRFLDDEESSQQVTIKLSSGFIEEEDDHVFFFCNSLSGLKSLTSAGCEDFIVTEINSFE